MSKKSTLYNDVLDATSLYPVARTNGTASGTSVDMRGGVGGVYTSALILIHAGTITDGTHTVVVEESDDDTTFTAVADADLQGTEPVMTASGQRALYAVGYHGSKRYVRPSIGTGSSTTGGIIGASILRGYGSLVPVPR